MKIRMLALSGLAVLVAAIYCCSREEAEKAPGDAFDAPHPLAWTAPPLGGLVEWSPGEPFQLELGRGSGWHGLDTVAVSESGRATLHRRVGADWQTAGWQLPPGATEALAGLVQKHQLLSLKGGYHAHVADGTQWVFCLRQGGDFRSIYCNNYFPAAIRAFAVDLDRLLGENGLPTAVWHPAEITDAREHEKALWDSIRTKPFIAAPPR